MGEMGRHNTGDSTREAERDPVRPCCLKTRPLGFQTTRVASSGREIPCLTRTMSNLVRSLVYYNLLVYISRL